MKKFLLNIVWILGWPFIGLAFLMGVLKLWSKAKGYRSNPSNYLPADRYHFVYKMVKKYLFLKNVKVESDGFQNLSKTPYLFIANHKARMDVLGLLKIMCEANNICNFAFLAKMELSASKTIKSAMELMDSVFIVREDLRQALEIAQLQAKNIRSGKSMIIFAEGTRVKKHEMGEFKGGSLKVAYDCAVPIVPISIYGTLGLRDTAENNVKPIGNTMYVSCLKPIRPSEFINASTNNVASEIGNSIATEYQRMKNLVESKKKPFIKDI